MIDDILDFLPIYPDIKSDNFNMDIFRKKEFYDEKLSKIEKPPEKPGTLLKGQTIISRFLSSYTPYNGILIKWDLGTGKTCASVGAIEKIKSEKNSFTGALIFARGETLLENYKNEIIFRCTSGQYIPYNYKDLTPGEQVARKNKALKEYYDFFTFESFSNNEVENNTDQYLIEKYSNKIIVIDEVHNIRLQDKSNKRKEKEKKKKHISIYNNFYRFLHLLKNCKIILMSGTPIKDNISEIASVMNLILPEKEKLPTDREFIKEYFELEDKVYKMKEDKKDKFKKIIRGRISYLESTPSEVRKQFAGESIGTLKHFKVYPDIMREFQSNVYKKAYEKDHKPRKEDENSEEEFEEEFEDETETDDVKGGGKFDTNSRQASLFVFPDETYGKDAFNNSDYIISAPKKILTTGQVLKTKTFKLGTELKKALNARTNDEILKKLEKYSSKYAAVIRNILQSAKEGKSSFVYSEYVKGSGCILFSLILNLFGFSQYTGKEKLDVNLEPKLRYAIITNETTIYTETKNIIERFNKPSNMNGKIINVIIGSEVVSEGLSFFNIQNVHILTPHWNYSETAQAIARGYRFGSHKDLINSGIIPEFIVYQYVSLSDNPKIESIDLKLYEISERKDINIKGVEQIIKQSAFDCALTYERNHITGYDYQRECNYTLCDYKCDDINTLEVKDIDYSSYQVYYNNKNIEDIIDKIKEKFKTTFKLKLSTIIDNFKEYILFDIITALRDMINNNIVIYNKYGIQSYLREENNVFFLVDSISNQNNYFSNYYNKKPVLNIDVTYETILNNIYYKKLPGLIEKLFNSDNKEEIISIINNFQQDLKEFILENSIIAKNLDVEINIFQRNIIIEYFQYSLETIDNILISSLLYREKDIVRCLDLNNIEGGWVDCDENYTSLYKESKQKKKQELKQNEYFGTYNKDKFCIVKSNFAEDKRNENKGRVCTTWKKPVLVYIMVNILKMGLVIPDKSKWDAIKKISKKGRDTLIDTILDNKNIKVCTFNEEDNSWDMDDYEYETLDEYSNDDLEKMLYYSKLTVKQHCELIKDWFDENNILSYDENCGTANKKN